MNGKWSVYWIVILFVALVIGPSFILTGPRRLTPGSNAPRVSIEPERLSDFRDAPASIPRP
ncbi:MAG: hypothetical protein HY922_13095 [Elusimicrobia bacterium]|nr:hypothetical protein [Elusimicrobiota bacterium]